MRPRFRGEHRLTPVSYCQGWGGSKKFCSAAAIETAEWRGDPCQAQGWKRRREDGKRGALKGWRGEVKRERQLEITSHFCARF